MIQYVIILNRRNIESVLERAVQSRDELLRRLEEAESKNRICVVEVKR